MSFDSTMRYQALDTIYRTVYALIDHPPRMSNRHGTVDLGKLEDKLNEVKPFWEAYLKVAEPLKHTYSVQNMNEDERKKYLDIVWWMGLLHGVLAAAEQTGTTPTGGV